MKRSILVAALAVAAVSAPAAVAQDTKHDHAKPATSMDTDKHMSHMQESMKAMQGQMDRIRKTTDPKERQKLMQEHMQAMQENMKMMRGMGGATMSGGGMMMGGKKDGMADGHMMKRHEMMEKRMDMMQMMMEQMMQREQMQQMPAK